MKAHCLFEQSGTFKNEFIKLGIPAEDYDIQNEFGETDHVVDLFDEIRKGYDGQPSIFDGIEKEDIVFAFFPCTRFSTKAQTLFRGLNYQQTNWSVRQKLEYDLKLHGELSRNYELITKLALIAIRGGVTTDNRKPVHRAALFNELLEFTARNHRQGQTKRRRLLQKADTIFFCGARPETNAFVRTFRGRRDGYY